MPARATIVGLNQIVTPDIQPAGVLALSAQVQHAQIGNSRQLQAELGLTRRLEVAWFEGFEPGEGMAAAELNLVHHGPHLLTAGIVNWSTRGGGAQPVLEYGWYGGKNQAVVGAIRATGHTDLLLGYKRELTGRVAFSADYQSGRQNFSTVGLTFNLSRSVSVNPALYLTNSHPHHLLGYVVLTWNWALWR